MNKFGKTLLSIGLIFIVVAISLEVYFIYLEKYAEVKSEEVLSELVSLNTEEDIDIINIDGNDYIGYISIEKLDLLLPITKNYTYESLKVAPTIYYGSIENKNLVICGHAYKAQFSKLYTLKSGDIIKIIDFNNNVYTYQVELIETLASSSIKEMIESEFDLTIYTCTKDGLKRVTVRCNSI